MKSVNKSRYRSTLFVMGSQFIFAFVQVMRKSRIVLIIIIILLIIMNFVFDFHILFKKDSLKVLNIDVACEMPVAHIGIV